MSHQLSTGWPAGTATTSIDNTAATSAILNGPRQIGFDSSGNFYINESGSNKIRLVLKGSGLLTTYAGSGTGGNSNLDAVATSALLWYNHGLAIDSSNNVYVANAFNGVIKKITRATNTGSTSTMSTYAGNGTRGFLGDGGAASSALFNYPYGLTFDASGESVSGGDDQGCN